MGDELWLITVALQVSTHSGCRQLPLIGQLEEHLEMCSSTDRDQAAMNIVESLLRNCHVHVAAEERNAAFSIARGHRERIMSSFSTESWAFVFPGISEAEGE